MSLTISSGVVLDEDTPPEKLRLAAGYEARRGYRQPADVVPCRESTFRRRARVPARCATPPQPRDAPFMSDTDERRARDIARS